MDPTSEFAEGVLYNSAAFQEFDLPPLRGDSVVQREADEFLLLREMQHRFANTFTALSSALRREFALSTSPGLQDSLARCEQRIVAFGNLHRRLLVGAANEWMSVQSYVEHLCEALSEAVLEPLGIRCEVFVDAGELPGERCERLGLVIAELAMNAAKHAFVGRSDGMVRVELFNRIDSWVCIVSDNGIGSRLSSPGAGSKILDKLVQSLDGTLARKSGPDGTSVIVTCRI